MSLFFLGLFCDEFFFRCFCDSFIDFVCFFLSFPLLSFLKVCMFCMFIFKRKTIFIISLLCIHTKKIDDDDWLYGWILSKKNQTKPNHARHTNKECNPACQPKFQSSGFLLLFFRFVFDFFDCWSLLPSQSSSSSRWWWWRQRHGQNVYFIRIFWWKLNFMCCCCWTHWKTSKQSSFQAWQFVI